MSIAPHVTFHCHTHLSRPGTKQIGKIGIGRLGRAGLDGFFHGDIVELIIRQTNNFAIERVPRCIVVYAEHCHHFMPVASCSSSLAIKELGQFFWSCLGNKPG